MPTYPFWIPCDCTDSLPALVVECETLFLGLDIPNCHKARAATGDQNVRNLLIPVQAVDVVCAGSVVAQSEWVLDVVQIPDKQLPIH